MINKLPLNSVGYSKLPLLEQFLEMSVSHRILDSNSLISFVERLFDAEGGLAKLVEIETFVRGRFLSKQHSEAFIESLLVLESKLLALKPNSSTPKPTYKSRLLSSLIKLWSPLHFELSQSSLIYQSRHGELEYWYSQKTGESIESKSGCWMIKRESNQIKVTPISRLQFQLVKRIQKGWSYSKLCKHYTNEQIKQNLLPVVCGGILVVK